MEPRIVLVNMDLSWVVASIGGNRNGPIKHDFTSVKYDKC